jgi:hypothetical protein
MKTLTGSGGGDWSWKKWGTGLSGLQRQRGVGPWKINRAGKNEKEKEIKAGL